MLSNRKFVQHEVARQQRIYEESIRKAKPHPDIASLDFNEPIKCPKNRRKELMIERRNKEIEFENEVLQRHLLDIKKHETVRPPKSPIGFKPKSMNYTRRKAEYEKINKENAMFLKELQNIKPQYSYKEDMKNFELTKKYLEVSSARGYNPYLVVHKKQQQPSPRSLPPLSGRKNENSQNPQQPKKDKSKSYKKKVTNGINTKKEEDIKEKNEEVKQEENEVKEKTEIEENKQEESEVNEANENPNENNEQTSKEEDKNEKPSESVNDEYKEGEKPETDENDNFDDKFNEVN